ncbi:MAG: TetR/AcrR family transcriptional regulator [Tateyamaria sp.]|jgi:AcrR family transcriptional regulator|nr:TetR/AcrR family transcriptional regulator [Tateyamaria sp.]
MSQTTPPTRGRPTTLDQDGVLDVSLMQYWEHGPQRVSINHICKLIDASKPAIYRAFGSDDELKARVLDVYEQAAITPLLNIFEASRTFDETVNAVIDFMMQDRDVLGIPKGCLFVMMRAHQDGFGPKAVEKLDLLRERFRKSISNWVEGAKSKNQFDKNVPVTVATHFVDAQHAGAMRMQKEGVAADQIERFLRFGFATLRG